MMGAVLLRDVTRKLLQSLLGYCLDHSGFCICLDVHGIHREAWNALSSSLTGSQRETSRKQEPPTKSVLHTGPPPDRYRARSSGDPKMGNTSSERPGPQKGSRRDSGGKGEDRAKILMDSPEDADLFPAEDSKAMEKAEFLAWRHDVEENDKAPPTLARPTVFRWTGGGKEIYLSGSFNNWGKIPLIKSHNNFAAILDLPEGEHQYKFYVDGHWTHDPSEPVVTSQLGTVNNVIQVKKTDFEVFDALMVDSQKCSDPSELSSSPPGPYHQDPYTCKLEERFKSPPILPPHLLQVILNKDTGISCDPALLPEPNHVMLNHLYALSIKDGVMVLSATHRYKKKYVTTLLYKPI